jgi:hypothetical protein
VNTKEVFVDDIPSTQWLPMKQEKTALISVLIRHLSLLLSKVFG